MLIWQRGAAIAALLAVSVVAVASADAHEESSSGRVPVPVHPEGKGDKCVRDTAYMRRHHMELLKHQRDETVHKGIRTTEYSLKNCVSCHASKDTNSVLGKNGFCQSCHSYAAVTLDCFECHASKPKAATPFHSALNQDGKAGEGGLASDRRQESPTTPVEQITTGEASK
ncbi:MAG: hypothetical protein ACK4ZS_02020 [Sulfurimicrobium sp.]